MKKIEPPSFFDLAVIGAGPGGVDGALRARELGFKVALIEKSDAGGTCLNTGCIPTKSLLASAKLLTQISRAESFGLSPITPAWDLPSLIQRKNRVVETLKKGMLESLKRSGVEWINGEATFIGKSRLIVNRRGAVSAPTVIGRGDPAPTNTTQEIEARWILIATGSEPIPFPGVPFDGEKVLSSTQLLEVKRRPPEKLLILGGGVVGVEFASIFQPLGVKVTVVEMLERIIASEDEEVSRRLDSLFRRKGIEIHTGEKVKSLVVRGGRMEAALESGKKLEADQVLVAIGRHPRIESLALEKAGVKAEKGAVAVNEYLETSTPGIFAIGDVTNRSTGLAHGASSEGIRVVENLKGPKAKMDYSAIPNCIYTDPEVASVGAIRAEPTAARPTGGLPPEETIESKILFSSLGKSHIEGETEGFLKMIASKKDGRILGVTGIGAHVTELIHEATLAVKAGLTVKMLAETIHAHPTESEILQKAAAKLLH